MNDREKVAREHVVGPVGKVIGNDGPQANLVEPIVRWFVHSLPVGTELFDEPPQARPEPREREHKFVPEMVRCLEQAAKYVYAQGPQTPATASAQHHFTAGMLERIAVAIKDFLGGPEE